MRERSIYETTLIAVTLKKTNIITKKKMEMVVLKKKNMAERRIDSKLKKKSIFSTLERVHLSSLNTRAKIENESIDILSSSE